MPRLIYWFDLLTIYFQTPTQVVFLSINLLSLSKKQDKTNKNI